MGTRSAMLCVALSLAGLYVSFTHGDPIKPVNITYSDKFQEFDWHLSKAVGETIKSNVIISPISIKLVLAMLYEGAGGTTAKELEDVLVIEKGPAPSQRFSNILQSLQAPNEENELDVGMKLIIDKEAVPKKSYAKKIFNLYNATIDTINFKNTSAAVAHINAWAKSVTKGHIERLLSEADAYHGTLMLLLNAVYFKGLWKYPFALNETKEGTFITDQNIPVTVEYMTGAQTLLHYDSSELKSNIIRLPYVGDKFAMYILLPDNDTTLNEVLEILTPAKVRSCLNYMTEAPVRISLPKFKFEFAASLAPILKQLGINEIFSNKADLRNIAEGPRDPVVSNVIQKAVIEVNELGTTAAAVTAVELVNKFGMNTVPFNVSRPFMFFIEDKLTSTVIFIGKVVNPEGHGKPVVGGASPLKPFSKPVMSTTSSGTSNNLPGNTNNTLTE